MALWRSKNYIKQKNKLYLKFEYINSSLNDELYKSYKSKSQKLIRVATKHNYNDLFVKYSNYIN